MKSAHDKDYSRALIALLKGVVYRQDDEVLWHHILSNRMAIRDYMETIGLDAIIDESEGFAYLRQIDEADENVLPRLISRRQLSFPVSMILALLRRKLAENDASGPEDRLIMVVEDVKELVATFLPAGTNEARLSDNLDAQIQKVADFGFIRKVTGEGDKIEVLRIIKAFVDAQWLKEFDDRLAEYATHLKGRTASDE